MGRRDRPQRECRVNIHSVPTRWAQAAGFANPAFSQCRSGYPVPWYAAAARCQPPTYSTIASF